MIVLAVGAARAEPGADVGRRRVLILGVLMTGTETAIVSNAYFIAGAAVLLAGGVAVAAGLWPRGRPAAGGLTQIHILYLNTGVHLNHTPKQASGTVRLGLEVPRSERRRCSPP